MFLPSSRRIHRADKEGYLIQTIYPHKRWILQFPEVWKSWIWRYVEVSEEVVFKNIWVFEMLNSKGLLSPVPYLIIHKSQRPVDTMPKRPRQTEDSEDSDNELMPRWEEPINTSVMEEKNKKTEILSIH